MIEKPLIERITKRGNINAQFVAQAVERLKDELLTRLQKGYTNRLLPEVNQIIDKIFGDFGEETKE